MPSWGQRVPCISFWAQVKSHITRHWLEGHTTGQREEEGRQKPLEVTPRNKILKDKLDDKTSGHEVEKLQGNKEKVGPEAFLSSVSSCQEPSSSALFFLSRLRRESTSARFGVLLLPKLFLNSRQSLEGWLSSFRDWLSILSCPFRLFPFVFFAREPWAKSSLEWRCFLSQVLWWLFRFLLNFQTLFPEGLIKDAEAGRKKIKWYSSPCWCCCRKMDVM